MGELMAWEMWDRIEEFFLVDRVRERTRAQKDGGGLEFLSVFILIFLLPHHEMAWRKFIMFFCVLFFFLRPKQPKREKNTFKKGVFR